MNGQRIDPRQSDLIDLGVRLGSPLVVLWVRPFGTASSGFWPALVLAIVVSFAAPGVLWLLTERHFDPFRGLMTSEPPGRVGIGIGAVAGVVTLFVCSRLLGLPAAGQRLQWDDGMFGLALVLLAAIFAAGAAAILLSGKPAPQATTPERPRVASLVDLIRRHANMEAVAWLAKEPDESALVTVETLSHSSDPDVRRWIVSNSSARLGAQVADMLFRVASSDDRDDVRDAAIDRLVEIAPERGEAFWPPLRLRLRSADQMDVELAAWKLFGARDPELRTELAEVSPSWEESDYIRDSFKVLGWCLDGDRKKIVEMIREQNLTLLPWLVKAAFALDDPQVWDAIAFVAEKGSDVRAKRQYARALRSRYSSAVPDLGD